VHYSLIIFSCKHYVVIDIYICILSLITLYRGSLNPCTELNFLLCYAVLTYIFNYFHHKSNSVGCYCYYSGCCHQNNHLNDDFVAAAAAVAVAVAVAVTVTVTVAVAVAVAAANVVPEEEVVIAVDNNFLCFHCVHEPLLCVL